ncbi:MAG: CinA family protein [Clostridiales bacterium]|nr:CinA family protein [Clostridiales bacterium]
MSENVEYVKKIVETLKARGEVFCTAESCTGGQISKTVTDLAGVSAVFFGGVVSYANEIKEKLLGVRHKTLEKYGAVSEQTAAEMATGAVRALGADFSVAVTGIAGPDGGSEEKPVGLVYIACADKNGNVKVTKNLFSGDRKAVRDQTTKTALQMLADFVV